MHNRIYFDNAATTALDKEVLDEMLPYLTEKFGNPSSIYSYGRESKIAIESARKSVANNLGARPSEIFFTSGGTESNNTAIKGAVYDLGCKCIITSAIEHHAVKHTVEYLHKHDGIALRIVKLLPNGHVDMEHLEALLSETDEKKLVSLMHANNEIGNKLHLGAVGKLCKKYNALFHSDCVQTVGHFPFNLQDTPVHFISASAHKFHGPKGAGILYIKEGLRINPSLHGGGQERNMRAGTENLYGIVGFAKALDNATRNFEKDSSYIQSLKTYLHQQLMEQFVGVSFNGDVEGNSLYTLLSVNFPKNDKSEFLLYNLDMIGICASGGSACSSGAEQGSHVLRALNTSENNVTVRFSFSKNNTVAEIDEVIEKLQALV